MEPRQHECRTTSATTRADPARDAFFRGLLENPPFPRNSSLEEQRDIMDSLSSMNPALPHGVAVELVTLASGESAQLITPSEAHPRRAILYAHGGAFINGRSPSVWQYPVYRIAAAAHASLLYVLYRLAPEHPFPAARDDVIAGYAFLTAAGYEPKHVVYAADSAGVNIALTALLALRARRGTPCRQVSSVSGGGSTSPRASTRVISPTWIRLRFRNSSTRRPAPILGRRALTRRRPIRFSPT